MEWFERCVSVERVSWANSGGAVTCFCGTYKRSGVDGLPYCEESVDVHVMEPEDRVEGGVVDLDVEVKCQSTRQQENGGRPLPRAGRK